MNTNSRIKFTGRYSLITFPSTAIPERLPIKNICEISSHIFLYRFIASTIIAVTTTNIKSTAMIARILKKSMKSFCISHLFSSDFYFFFGFTDFQLSPFPFATNFCFCLFCLFFRKTYSMQFLIAPSGNGSSIINR